MGHVGLTPQAVSVIGGFRAQGRTADQAQVLLDEALRLQDAGCFSIVLECVPAHVGAAITDRLDIPTIGIGAGGGTSGQVLVYHDMMGLLSSTFVPKFCKQYAQVGSIIQQGLEAFKADVESNVFPGEEYSPYGMSEGEQEAFDRLLQKHDRKNYLVANLGVGGGTAATPLAQPGQHEQRGQMRPEAANRVSNETRDSQSLGPSSLPSVENVDDGVDLYGGSRAERAEPLLTVEDGSLANEHQRRA
jgi:Ketopantoate hydroxymethyltransferase